jgi:hypothetical protein
MSPRKNNQAIRAALLKRLQQFNPDENNFNLEESNQFLLEIIQAIKTLERIEELEQQIENSRRQEQGEMQEERIEESEGEEDIRAEGEIEENKEDIQEKEEKEPQQVQRSLSPASLFNKKCSKLKAILCLYQLEENAKKTNTR